MRLLLIIAVLFSAVCVSRPSDALQRVDRNALTDAVGTHDADIMQMLDTLLAQVKDGTGSTMGAGSASAVNLRAQINKTKRQTQGMMRRIQTKYPWVTYVFMGLPLVLFFCSVGLVRWVLGISKMNRLLKRNNDLLIELLKSQNKI